MSMGLIVIVVGLVLAAAVIGGLVLVGMLIYDKTRHKDQ